MRPFRSPRNLKLNKPAVAVWVNAVLVTRVSPVRPALQDSMVTMVSMDSQANPEIVVAQHPTLEAVRAADKNNAHALLHQATEDPKDPKALTELQEMQVDPALMDNPEPLDQPDHPAQLALLVNQVQLALLAMQENLQVPVQVRQVHQAPTVNQEQPAQPVNQAVPAKMAVPAVPVVQVMLAPQDPVEKLAVQAPQAIQAKTALQAAANTAHPLVWLQVIKRRLQTRFGGDTEFRSKSIPTKRPTSSTDFSPEYISASCVFTSHFLVVSLFLNLKNA